jgi:threonine/homoserine/homoserine lactone efflux protein
VMDVVIHTLVMGIILGFSAGLAPGPLLTLVITETLRHSVKSGLKVALAPLITDVPVVLAAFFILVKASASPAILAVISFAGGGFVFYLGYDGIRTKGGVTGTLEPGPGSLTKAVIANLLNPHPYLFWLSVGAPIMTGAMKENPAAPVAFIIGFYTCLVGSKMTLAVLVGRSKAFLRGRAYRYVMRFLGVVLCILAILLLRDGIRLLRERLVRAETRHAVVLTRCILPRPLPCSRVERTRLFDHSELAWVYRIGNLVDRDLLHSRQIKPVAVPDEILACRFSPLRNHFEVEGVVGMVE